MRPEAKSRTPMAVGAAAPAELLEETVPVAAEITDEVALATAEELVDAGAVYFDGSRVPQLAVWASVQSF